MIEVVLKDPKTGTAARLPTQPISGQFLVRPDGTVGLGVWGSVVVSGMTVDEAGRRIRDSLARAHPTERAAEQLVVVVDVLAYNSECYYVITDSAENGGERVHRCPITGSETVLDAIAQVGGLSEKAATASLRLMRKRDHGTHQILPVEWLAWTRDGVSATNYQLLPGDRPFVTTRGKD